MMPTCAFCARYIIWGPEMWRQREALSPSPLWLKFPSEEACSAFFFCLNVILPPQCWHLQHEHRPWGLATREEKKMRTTLGTPSTNPREGAFWGPGWRLSTTLTSQTRFSRDRRVTHSFSCLVSFTTWEASDMLVSTTTRYREHRLCPWRSALWEGFSPAWFCIVTFAPYSTRVC